MDIPQMLSVLIPFLLGIVVAFASQYAYHFFALKRDSERWSREEPDRIAARELQESLERQRLKHSYRKERLGEFLSEFDELLRPLSFFDTIENPEFSDRIKAVLERDVPRGIAAAQENTSNKAHQLLTQLPAITDQSTRSKISIVLLALAVQQDIRNMLIEAVGKDLNTLATEAYAALESYVVAES